MKRSIDSNDLKGALEHATDMLRELKSNTLNPKTYYELYMKVMEFSIIFRNIDDFYKNYFYIFLTPFRLLMKCVNLKNFLQAYNEAVQ